MTLKTAVRFSCLALALIALVLTATAPLFAITDEEIFRDFRFNFINPGARALGLGGAFVAMADDSTATLANPAGLVWLKRPELFEEFRVQTVDTTETIEVNTDPTATVLGATGTIASSTEPKNTFSPSFFSYVYPAGKWAVGIARQELFNIDNRTSSSNTFDPSFFGGLTFTGRGEIDTEISNWIVSGAYKITDTLSVGVSAVYSIMNLDSRVDNTFIDNSGFLVDDGDPNTPCLVCGIEIPFYTTKIHDTDSDLSYNLGISWNIVKQVTVAASYRKGSKFTVTSELAQFFSNGAPFFEPAISDPNVIGPTTEVTFHVPDSYSLGVAYRPLDRLTLSVEAARIEYEDLLDGFTSGMNILTFKDCNTSNCSPNNNHPGANFVVEDRTELHLGGEYIFTVGTNPLAVRLGLYTDPDNRVRADFEKHTLATFGGFPIAPSDGQSLLSTNDSFPERDDELHITAGAGIVIQDRFQVDVAVDFSDIADQYVLSSIYRF